MKKISAKSRNKSRSECTPDCLPATILAATEEHEGGGDAATPTLQLGNVGVKVEGEGQVVGLVEAVEEVVDEPWEEITPPPDLSQGYVVDLTQQFNRIFVQSTFDSFKEFEKLFNKFKAETGSVFRIKSSCSVAYENSRRKRYLIPSRFKFVTVRYCCVHFGQPKVAGQGIRVKQRYLPCGCQSVLSLSYNRGALVVSQANMQHNHEVSSKMAPFYAINRRISNAELKDVAGVVEMIPSSRALQHFLQINFRRPTTLQDAKNVRARLKALKVPQASIIKSQISEESMALFREEEEEEEEAVIDSIDGVDFNVQDEVVREGGELSECDYWGEATPCKVAKRQQHQQQHQEELGEGEEEEQEPDLDPGTRRKVLSEVNTRLFSVLESCNTTVFRERVSVIERLIEGWENDEPVHLQYMERSDFKARRHEPFRHVSACATNTSMFQQKIESENDRNTNSCTSIDGLNIALPVLETNGKSQFYPAQVNKLTKMDCKSQSRVGGVMELKNGNRSIMNHISDSENSTQLYRTDTQRSTEIRKSEKRESNDKRPIIISIVKGFVGGGEQAVEVEIEVDGEEAKVKTVKREPLDYYEVNVGD